MNTVFSKPIRSKGGYNLVLIHGFDHTKRKVFHYLAIKKVKLEVLKKKISRGEISLKECGTVLMSEYGYEPTQAMHEEALRRFAGAVEKPD